MAETVTSGAAVVGGREVPCPRCGYDLRGAGKGVGECTGGGAPRCPECGLLVVRRGYSHLPWVRRKYLGEARTHLATLWLVLARPGKLARELTVPARVRDARKFERLNLVLMAEVAAGVLAIRFLAHDNPLWLAERIFDAFFGDSRYHHFTEQSGAIALQHQWYVVFPLILGLYAAGRVCLWIYRGLWLVDAGPRFRQRRMACAARYLSAMWLVETALLGLMVTQRQWFHEVADLVGRTRYEVLNVLYTGLCVSLGVAALGLFLYVTLTFGLRARPRWPVLLQLAFPPVALVVGNIILLWVQVMGGYMIVAVRSMTL